MFPRQYFEHESIEKNDKWQDFGIVTTYVFANRDNYLKNYVSVRSSYKSPENYWHYQYNVAVLVS